MHKINHLVLAPGVAAAQARLLLAPFRLLSKIYVVCMDELSFTEPIFPETVIKVRRGSEARPVRSTPPRCARTAGRGGGGAARLSAGQTCARRRT